MREGQTGIGGAVAMRTFVIVLASAAALSTLALVWLAMAPRSLTPEQRAVLAVTVALFNQASGPCYGAFLKSQEADLYAALSIAKPPLTLAELRAGAAQSDQYRRDVGQQKWCIVYNESMERIHGGAGRGPD